VRTLLHTTAYVFTEFAKCTSTDCKYNEITKKSQHISVQPASYSARGLLFPMALNIYCFVPISRRHACDYSKVPVRISRL
jgi:hypothetical protein